MSSDTPNNLTPEQRQLAIELGLNPDAIPPLRQDYFALTHGEALAKIDVLERELAALKAEIEHMKIDAGKAYCVYCGTSGPKADIWKHVTVCDKHPLKTMADKMEEASGMIQVAMLIFDELGLSGDATAVTAVESIQKLKAENERLREALEFIGKAGGTWTEEGMHYGGLWCATRARAALAKKAT